MKSAIYMDNNRFIETEFASEAEFEEVIRKNSKTLFGEKTIYYNLKSKIESKSLGSAIPDGFLFDFRNETTPEFYLVEVELESHDFYRHIFPQITKFFAFFKRPTNRNNLIEKLFSLINSNPKLKNEFEKYLKEKEIYKTLKDTIENSQNVLLILDENKPELEDVAETYTETWGKIVQVEILKQYKANEQVIFTMNPDFENIGFAEPLREEDETERDEERIKTLSGEKLFFKLTLEELKIKAPEITNAKLIHGSRHAYIEIKTQRRGVAFYSGIDNNKVYVDLYLGFMGDKLSSQKAFEFFLKQKDEIEKQVGQQITWERKKACRLVIRKKEDSQETLFESQVARSWVADTLIKLYQTLNPQIPRLR
jgi:hypothetical protein